MVTCVWNSGRSNYRRLDSVACRWSSPLAKHKLFFHPCSQFNCHRLGWPPTKKFYLSLSGRFGTPCVARYGHTLVKFGRHSNVVGVSFFLRFDPGHFYKENYIWVTLHIAYINYICNLNLFSGFYKIFLYIKSRVSK